MSKSISYEQIILEQLTIPIKLLTKYQKLGLEEIDLTVILQLLRFFRENNDFPTPSEIVENMTINEKECATILRKLIQKGFLKIEQRENKEHQLSESYSLNPLFKRLFTDENSQEEQNEGSIFILFEQEFGRPLSPFEIEMVNSWLDEDNLTPALIKAALRESVLMGKLNFKYMDRILREWMKKGIRSVDEARNASRNFHQYQSHQTEQGQKKKRDTSFYYNWLEGED